MPLDIVNVHFDCAGSRNLGSGDGCVSRLRSRCGAVRIRTWLTFRGKCKGNLVFWWSKVAFSRQVQGIGAVLLRYAIFVAGAALWTWW